jgi:hypothetical protein
MQSTLAKMRQGPRCGLIVAALLATAACAPSVQNTTATDFDNGTSAGPSDNRGGTVPHQVIDSEGFGQPIPAMTLDVPAGWSAASQIRWDNANGQCSLNVASANVRLTAPDGKAQIEMLPGYIVSSYSDPILSRGSVVSDYCVVAMADSGETLVRDIALPALRRGWSVEAMNAVAIPADLQSMVERLQAATGGMSQYRPYAIETTLRSPDGTLVEKLYMAGFVSAGAQTMPGMRPMVMNQNTQTWAVRAPRERLAEIEAVGQAVRASVKVDPAWKQRIDDHFEQLNRRSRPNPRGGSSSSGGGSGGSSGNPGFDMDRWREDQRRDDIDQRRRVDGIREEEECVDPDTGRRYRVSVHVGCRT